MDKQNTIQNHSIDMMEFFLKIEAENPSGVVAREVELPKGPARYGSLVWARMARDREGDGSR